MNPESPQTLGIMCAVGTPDFCRRIGAIVQHGKQVSSFVSGTTSEAWSLILTHRPSIIIIEIHRHHSARHHLWLRRLLASIRERLGNEIYVIAALTSSERFAFAGDLLFSDDQDLTPSNFIDTFIVIPPPDIPTIATLPEQLSNTLQLYVLEMKRRGQKKIALPHLNHSEWIQSQADPASRELWMRWLPRYASYVNESPLIIGDTGTGKTKLAFALHKLSGREGQFVSITPRDFSSSELVQAELFGAVAGAYTGAVDKWGLVKSAEKGTLFIDELQSIDKDLQGKLITFIENKIYRRVGSAERIEADVRFVFASNRSIDDMIENNILREDFAYRLERVQLKLAPLNTRRLDIAAALAFALAKIHRQRPTSTPLTGFSSAAYRILFCHSWPGNLRQLENTIAQLCEVADINQLQVIDESTVLEVLGSKLTSQGQSLREIVSYAAQTTSKEVLEHPPKNIAECVNKFVDQIRVSAIEACSGDFERAANLTNDTSSILKLLAESISAKRALEHLT